MQLDRFSAKALLKQVLLEGMLEQGTLIPEYQLADPISRKAILAGMAGYWHFGSLRVEVQVFLPAGFPRTLPVFVVPNHTALEPIPHIMSDGFVCYFESEGLVVDDSRPLEVLQDSLIQAKKTLDDGFSGRNFADVFEEIESYWPSNKTQGPICNVEPNDSTRLLTALLQQGEYVAVGDNRSVLVDHYKRLESKELVERNGLYLPLEPSVRNEKFHPRNLNCMEDLERLLASHITSKNLAVLEKRRGTTALLVLGFPKPKGGKALVGLCIRNIESRSLFGNKNTKLERVNLQRCDNVVIQQRTTRNLHEKKVAIVGCGALGGHIASCLAWAGVRRLSLVDPEDFKPENIMRHTLGRSGLERSKTDALQRELQAKVPSMEIDNLPVPFEDAVGAGRLNLADCFLVVVTVGSPNTSFHINQMLRNQRSSPPVVFTWLEPYGIGGHSILLEPKNEGCYKCLFNDDPTFGLVNLSDFAAPGQNFSKHDFGCSGLFVPYSDLDARETAQLATRQILDALKGSNEPHLRSWKGDSTDFTNAGFKLSPRYMGASGTLPLRGHYARKGCSVCSANK